MQQEPFNQRNKNYLGNTAAQSNQVQRIVIIATASLLGLALIILVIFSFIPANNTNKITRAAIEAAQAVTPDATVEDVVVADGFAMALVSDPHTDSQGSAGNRTFFSVAKDGSMKQIISGSDFNPITLLELSIPLETQAKLRGQPITELRYALASSCGYADDMQPGYIGFGGTFQPDDWQIDAATLTGLQRALSQHLTTKNKATTVDKRVICVDATRENSNVTTDTATYISTFTLQTLFITGAGETSPHTITFAIGPKNYHKYTIDDKEI